MATVLAKRPIRCPLPSIITYNVGPVSFGHVMVSSCSGNEIGGIRMGTRTTDSKVDILAHRLATIASYERDVKDCRNDGKLC